MPDSPIPTTFSKIFDDAQHQNSIRPEDLKELFQEVFRDMQSHNGIKTTYDRVHVLGMDLPNIDSKHITYSGSAAGIDYKEARHLTESGDAKIYEQIQLSRINAAGVRETITMNLNDGNAFDLGTGRMGNGIAHVPSRAKDYLGWSSVEIDASQSGKPAFHVSLDSTGHLPAPPKPANCPS
jgi:hypothetical protein